jgi:flagellin
MGLQVFNNSAAFNVWTNFSANTTMMQKSMEHLATGVKSSADDPSGIGISERMRSQSRNVAKARNNVDNSISLLQTADSWLQKINDMLARMSELSIEVSDGTKTLDDKSNVQIEFEALQEEITRITSKNTTAAKYNGLYLFRGGNGIAVVTGDGVQTGNISVQVGSDNGQIIDLNLVDLQVTNNQVIGTTASYQYDSNNTVTSSTRDAVSWSSIVDTTRVSASSAGAIGKIAQAIDFIANARARLGAQQNRLDQTKSALLSYEDNLRSSESKIRDIDMAFETTTFSKYQILSQVGNSMLAQANQLPQQILQLLG